MNILGALFWDRVNSWCILSEDDEFEFEGVNPCAEQPLPAFGSCLLGSINLSQMVEDAFTDESSFNFELFGDVVCKSVYDMNVVLDEGLDLHPLEQIKETVRNYRQIGLKIA